MFESLVEWKNGTVSTDIHLQAEISGSMPRVVLRESNLTNNRRMFNVEIDKKFTLINLLQMSCVMT